MIARRSMCAIALLFSGAVAAAAQEPRVLPLGDVARQAEAAKPTIKKAKKAYTNADLGAGGIPAPVETAPASGYVSTTLGKPVSEEELVTRSQAKVEEKELQAKPSESFWRQRAESIRGQIAKLKAQIAELSVPNAKRDANPGDAAYNARLIANANTGIDALMRQWTRFEDGAREEKVPMEWLDPRPSRQ